jgi:hypothetical protein
MADLERNRTRVSYELMASFISFLESARPGAVTAGILLDNLAEMGMENGFESTFQRSLTDLEDLWWSDLVHRYAPGELK